MKCIIIGAGKIGYSIAKLLSAEHDVTVVEQDEERQETVDNSLDVQVVRGSGASWKILEEAGVRSAHMLVAVTEIDELNMIACLLAKQYGVKTTIARVRNPEYVETPHFSPESLLGIDLIINPERVTALEIYKIIKNPEFLSVEYYAGQQVQMVEVLIHKKSALIGKKLKELDTSKFVIVSIVRKQQMIVPGGNDVLMPGDHIYVMANAADMDDVLHVLAISRQTLEQVIILGGGRTGNYLAEIIEKNKLPVKVKIIEKEYKKAKLASDRLKTTLVIHGDGIDSDLLEMENAKDADLWVALTGDDKINLLSSLIAKNIGVKKTIAQVKRDDIMPLMQQIGVDIVFSPRMLTAGRILKYIRLGSVVSVTVLEEDRAEMIELVVQPGSITINQQLQCLKFPKGAVIGAIVRDDTVIIPDGQSTIKPFDHLMIFCLSKSIHKVEKMFLSGDKR